MIVTPEPLEIKLAASDLVFRGFTGEEFEPAVLKGEVVLNLGESSSFKELSLVFTGTAKVVWRDTSTHHYEHPLFFHDFSFLNPSSSSVPHSSGKGSHSHTLAAGRHVFPFSLHVPGSLPASLRTYTGSCVTEYKLKAVASRPGFAADWKIRKQIRVTRGLGVDSAEYLQTLEIENTWPRKLAYAFTIPHKAYACGEIVPVSVKFSPLAKGVKIVSLVTTIREHTTVHSKSSSHSEARDATAVKFSFARESNDVPYDGVTTPPMRPGSGTSTPALGDFQHSRSPVAASSYINLHQPAASGSRTVLVPEDDGLDTEIDVVVEIPVPLWTVPSHAVYPVFVTHKIKWSAFIKNPDGHVSELRCALPIHILAPSLAVESSLASAGSRNLLFGENGVLAPSALPQVDLPSYQDHMMDRIANAETASYFSNASGFAPTPWSARSTPAGTPLGTSPPNSRPSSPTGRHSAPGHGGQSRPANSSHQSALASRGSSGSNTPVSPQVEDEQDHRNWIDSELMGSLALEHTSPPGSNPPSQPNSRPSSRPGSRPPSRPGSPEHGMSMSSSSTQAGNPWVNAPFPEPPPLAARSASSGSSFFHLHVPKPLRPLTAFTRTSSSSSASNHSGSNSHPSPSALSHALAMHAAKGQHGGRTHSEFNIIHTHSAMSNSPNGPSAANSPLSSSPVTSFASPALPFHLPNPHSHSHSHAHMDPHSPTSPPLTTEEANDPLVDFLSQVPSYSVASRGFLGGGVTPLSTLPPQFDDLVEEQEPGE